jgi:hypothetical protein
MSRFLIDEAPDPATYIAGHRASFGGTMDAAEFAWWFRREVGGPAADLWLYLDGDIPAAGSAVSYRRLATGELVAVMTGSWTDPRYRRQGLHRDTISRSRDLAAARGAQALLGFAMARRESIAPLTAASELVADAWLVEGSGNGSAPLGDEHPTVAELHEWFHRHRLGAHFAYEPDVFREQLRLDLPETEVRRLGASCWGVCRDGMLLTAVSERPWEAPEVAATVERSGLAFYTTVRTIGERRRAADARFFVMQVGRPVPDALRGPLDFHAVDRA